MNKKTYIIAILLFYTTYLFADKYLINSTTFYKNGIYTKTIFNYNSNKKIINETVFVSNDEIEWKNYTYSTRQYKDDAVSEICDYIWGNNTWTINKKQLFEYNNSKLISHTTSYNDIQEISTYEYENNTTTQKQQFVKKNTVQSTIVTIQTTHNNKISNIKTYSLSPKNDTIFAQITNFEYTANQTISTTFEKSNDTYIPIGKTITNFKNNRITSEIQYKYKKDNWIFFAKQTYRYNLQNQVTEIIYQIWKNNFWLSDYKRLYFYNEYGALTSSSIEILQYKEWETTYQINYNYKNQLCDAFIEQNFWGETDKEYNDYISLYGNNKSPFILCNNIQLDYTDIPTDIILNLSPIKVYPNPSKSGIVFIDTDLIIHNIDVFDINGILLYRNKYTGHLDLSHLNNGMYIIQITTNEEKLSFKQIINNY